MKNCAEVNKSIRRILEDSWGTDAPIHVDNSVSSIVMEELEGIGHREYICIAMRYGVGMEIKTAKEIGLAIGSAKNPDEPVKPAAIYSLIKRGIRRLSHPTRVRKISAAMGKTRVEFSQQIKDAK